MTPAAPAKGRAQAWAGLSPGTVEVVKWVALLLMIGGHTNAVVFDRQWAWPNEIGRAAFPGFAFAFGYAISRVPDQRWPAVVRRVGLRLMGIGLLCVPLTHLAFRLESWWSLNIMFTFAAGLAMIWGIKRGDTVGWVVAGVVFMLSGVLVEFMWPGVLLVVAMWASFQRPGMATQCLLFACLLALWPVNGNPYALLLYPVVALVALSGATLPRLRWLFYVAYPLHLLVLLGIRQLL